MCFPSTVIWIPSDPTRIVATHGKPCLKGKYFLFLECPSEAENFLEVCEDMPDMESWLVFVPTILLHCHNSSTGKRDSNVKQMKIGHALSPSHKVVNMNNDKANYMSFPHNGPVKIKQTKLQHIS